VTGPLPPDSRPGPPPRHSGGEPIALGKALVLAALAVVIGVFCADVGSRPVVDTGTASSTPSPTTTTTTLAGHPAPTTTTTTAPNPAVKVVVANGGTVTGAAAFFTAKLDAKGWSTLTPTNATSVSASAVYYAPGDQGPADTVATSLGLSPTVVHPISTVTPATGITGADVVLIVGPDLAAQVTPTTTTTAAVTARAGPAAFA